MTRFTDQVAELADVQASDPGMNGEFDISRKT
jgi:hypothetical protein